MQDLYAAFRKLTPETLVRVGGNALKQWDECSQAGADAWADVWASVAYTADKALTDLSGKTTG